jgi:hypothetical protein
VVTQIQERKLEALDALGEKLRRFGDNCEIIDRRVADLIRQRSIEFYEENPHLRPDCDRDWLEIAQGWFVSVVEWCQEHWKLIATVVIVGAALACLLVPGLNAIVAGLVFGKLLFAMAVGALIGAGIGGIAGGALSAITGGSFWEGLENGAFNGAVAGLVSGGMGHALTGGGAVVLGFGKALGIGAVSGMSASYVSDGGDILIKGSNISFGDFVTNMLISGALGALFAGLGSWASTLLKNASWFSPSRELFRIGATAKPSYGFVTSYTTSHPKGASLNFANRAGQSIFRSEFDANFKLHYHIPSLFGTNNAHIPLSPMVDSAISRALSSVLNDSHKGD